MRPNALPAAILALLAVVSLPAQQPAAPARGLTVVPAPVGPDGAMQELYSGSYALLIGVSRYDTPTAWAPLESIPQELDALAAALRQAGFQQVEQIKDPTGFELQQSVQEFMRRYGYQPGARVLFFFSGHGYTLEAGARGYFVPRDAPDPTVNEAGFRATAISMQQISTWAGELVSRHVLFAFDSCFSGTIFRTRNRVVPARISAATQRPVRQFLSAGGAGETVPARSVFTPVFIRALNGAGDLDSDGYVTGTELFNYVQREVIAYATGQTPQFGTVRDPRFDEGDLVFAVPGSRPAAAGAPGARPGDAASGRETPAAPAGPPPAAPAPAGGPSTEISVDLARRTLAGRGIPWTASSVASALSSADVEVLELFTKGRAEPGLLLEALGSAASDGQPVAQVFFERAKGSARALEWLRSALAQGLDPNATVKGQYYKREGLLNSAVRAGNAPAILALVDAGASPHAYQELWFTRYPTTRFLAPFNPIVSHETLTADEKKTIVERFLANGGVIPPLDSKDAEATTQASDLKTLRSSLESEFGLKVPAAPDFRAQSKAACQRIAARDKSVDWCGLIARMPARVLNKGYRVDWRTNPPPPGTQPAKAYHDFHYLELLGLLNVVDGKAYFLGAERDTYRSKFDVVEVSGDGRIWRVYRYMSEGAGMGICQKEDDYTPRECWRRISMTYHPDKKLMHVENYYEYDISMESGPR